MLLLAHFNSSEQIIQRYLFNWDVMFSSLVSSCSSSEAATVIVLKKGVLKNSSKLT